MDALRDDNFFKRPSPNGIEFYEEVVQQSQLVRQSYLAYTIKEIKTKLNFREMKESKL